MSNDPTLPNVRVKFLDAAGFPVDSWRKFLEKLSQQTSLTADQSAEIAALAERVTELEEQGLDLGSILGLGSVSIVGALGDQVIVQLEGDEESPAASHYYGTDVDGAKGYHAVPDQTTPYFISASDTYTVAVNKQALFTMPIDVEGFLAVDGYLIEVG